MFCPIDFLNCSIRSHFKSLHSFCILLFTVHVSDPYSTIIGLLHILVFITRFFRFLFGLLLSNSLLVEKLKMPLSYRCPFNFFMAFGISCIIILPRYQHSFICSDSFPPMCRPVLTTVFSLLVLNTIVLFDSCPLYTFVCDCVQSIINCLLRSRKELKFVLTTHAGGRVWTRRGADIQPGRVRGG